MRMRIIASTLIALGVVAAAAVSVPTAIRAQGFYVEGPGIEFGVGRPWYRDRYYHRYYEGPYAYYRPDNDWRWRYRHHRWRDWD
jgi:hypothetical protein